MPPRTQRKSTRRYLPWGCSDKLVFCNLNFSVISAAVLAFSVVKSIFGPALAKLGLTH